MSRTEKKHPDKVCPVGAWCGCKHGLWRNDRKKRAAERVELTEASKAVIDRSVERAIGCGVCGAINDPACIRAC